MDSTRVSREEIESRIKSKEDFILIFGIEGEIRLRIGGWFLPDRRSITWKWISDLLAGRKKLLKTTEVKTYVVPPKFDGIRVETLWQEVQSNAEWVKYFPDYLGRTPDKLYFFSVRSLLLTPKVMNTLVPNFSRDLMMTVAAEKKRRMPVEEKVVLSKEMAEFLQNQQSRTLGKAEKTGHYLKAGRVWSTNRSSNPYNITVGNRMTSPKKDQSKKTDSSKMDAEKKQ